MKEKLEKSHEAMQKARSQRQLEQAKQANIEKLVSLFEQNFEKCVFFIPLFNIIDNGILIMR